MKSLALMIFSIMLLFGIVTLAPAENNISTEQEILKLKIKELELRKQVLELEAQKNQRSSSQLPPPQQINQGAAKSPPSTPSTGSSGYIRGPRGGCYTYTKSGSKRYVARSLCD